MTLIETAADAETVAPADPDSLAFLTQTTLSVDDTAEIVAILQPPLPRRSRRRAARTSATRPRTARRRSRRSPRRCDAMLVIGAPNSSNSLRLVEVAEREGARARLVGARRRHRFRLARRACARSASPPAPRRPELLVREVVDRARRAVRRDRGAGRGRRGADGVQAARAASRPRDRRADRGRDLHRRRLQGQSRPGRLGRRHPRGRAREGAVRRRAADHQQPDGAAGRDPRAGGADPALPGRSSTPTASMSATASPSWIHGWRKNGWRTADRKPVKNAELWQELLDAAAPHRVEWHWVKGHSGHPENDRADALACAAALSVQSKRAAEIRRGIDRAGRRRCRAAGRRRASPRPARSGCRSRPAPRTRRSRGAAARSRRPAAGRARSCAAPPSCARPRSTRQSTTCSQPVDRERDVDLLGRAVAGLAGRLVVRAEPEPPARLGLEVEALARRRSPAAGRPAPADRRAAGRWCGDRAGCRAARTPAARATSSAQAPAALTRMSASKSPGRGLDPPAAAARARAASSRASVTRSAPPARAPRLR